MTEEWIEDPAIDPSAPSDPTDPTDPSDLPSPTDSPHPTGPFDSTDPTDPTDPSDPEMLTSIAPTNLRTEPKLGCAAAPNNPGMASSETESDGCDVTGPQYEPKSAVALPAETEPNDGGVPHADLERQNFELVGETTPIGGWYRTRYCSCRRFWCSSARVSWRMSLVGRFGLTAKSRAARLRSAPY